MIFSSVAQQDPEGLDKRLQTLCVSMTNHALDGKLLHKVSAYVIGYFC